MIFTVHAFDPILVKAGPFVVYWYGMMYLIGFLGAYAYCDYARLKQTNPWASDDIMDLFFYGALGVIFGGTWGYLILYDPHVLLSDPLRALRFWEAGRSFHGGLLGVLLALFIFARRRQRSFWEVTDFIAPAVPIGIATGRFGNFMNGELWGRVSDVPWAMIFPEAGALPRHPSQLYELGLEGIVLFIILQCYIRTPKPQAAVSGLFMLGYGVMRFIVEFFREPDIGQGFIAWGWITKGQILSIPMILIGLLILVYAYRYGANQTKAR